MMRGRIVSSFVAATIVVAAPATVLAGTDDEDDEDGTEAPTGVGTGSAAPGDDDTVLWIAAGALTALAGGAFALRRREQTA